MQKSGGNGQRIKVVSFNVSSYDKNVVGVNLGRRLAITLYILTGKRALRCAESVRDGWHARFAVRQPRSDCDVATIYQLVGGPGNYTDNGRQR